MPKLPGISGKEAVKRFERLGYKAVRQSGSHIRLIHQSDPSLTPLTVPNHKELGRGLLRKLLRDSRLTVKAFLALKK